MTAELSALAAQVTQPVMAAIAAYGSAVLATAENQAAETTVGIGRQLLQRVFGTRPAGSVLPVLVADVVADPQDEDAVAALRLAIRKALAADPQLAADVRSLTGEVSVCASGARSIAALIITGAAVTGDRSAIDCSS